MDEVQHSTKTVLPYLPREITDVIISFFRTRGPIGWYFAAYRRPDYKPLCNCALVCRHWLPASRHHLLANVWLDSDPQYNQFVSNVIRSPAASSWLPSTCRITLFPSTSRRTSSNGGDGMHIASRIFMHQLSGRLPNLDILELFNMNWDTKECSIPPRMFITLSAFASVRILTLADVRFPSSGTMRCIITALPSLTDLEMYNVTWPVSHSIRPFRSMRTSGFLKRIRWFTSLWISPALMDEMLEWLQVTAFGASLLRLHIELTTLIKDPELWGHVAPSATRLDMTFGGEVGELPSGEFAGSLSYFTHLQHIRFNAYLDNETFGFWEFIATFLSTASPNPNLKNLYIYLKWTLPLSEDILDPTDECGFVLRNAGVFEPILHNSLQGLLALDLELSLSWPSELRDRSDDIHTQFSQTIIEAVLRKKLSKTSRKVSFTVSVDHVFRRSFVPRSPEAVEDSIARAVSSS